MHTPTAFVSAQRESMNGMCSKPDIRRSSSISSSQLIATAVVSPGKRFDRPISACPCSIIRVWLSPRSFWSSSLQPVFLVANRVGAERGGRRGTSRSPSSALTQELPGSRREELQLSANGVVIGRSSKSRNSRTCDTVIVKENNTSVCGVSSLSSTCRGNHHYHCETQGLLDSRDRSRPPAVVPGGWRRLTVCGCGLPALSCKRGVRVVEREKSSRVSCRKAASSSRVSALSGKKTSGNFESMELFKPQLMDTMPFRFLSEYHTAPPRAAKDAVSPIFFFGFGQAKPVVEVVQAGDPVLHEPAVEVMPEEIGTARIEKIINDMVATMRNAPGVGLAAPQIGVNLQIIVLEDTKELMSYSSPEECEAQQRFPFDLLVIINPKLKSKSGSGSAVFFEGCLSVEGYRALVERDLEVEVTGLGRDGRPIRVEGSGWKARILQHECDHLAGTLYVDKMVPRTFRTKDNLRLPLPAGCPKQGVCTHSTKNLKMQICFAAAQDLVQKNCSCV